MRLARIHVLFVMALVPVGCADRTKFPGANVVLISIDTLRADHLSLYGYWRPTSPYLQKLAEDAVVFDQFVINGGFTLPSHITMMTSLKPTVHGMRARETQRLPEARVTLAELLKAEGYRTAAFVDAGWMRGKFGFAQGFDLYDDAGGRFRRILPKAYDWLEEHHEERFFLFLHTFDVHSQWRDLPYDCPAPYASRYGRDFSLDFNGCRDGRCATRLFKWIGDEARAGRLNPLEVLTAEEIEFSKALYAGCINYVDAKIAQIIEKLRSHEILDRTLIVITSDHGEEFLEHGLLLHLQHGFEESSRVPLILRFPEGSLGGRRVLHLAAMIDLMPTILDILDVPVSPEAQGRSLIPAILDSTPTRRDTTIWRALRTERWKYLPDRKLLFDLDNDPHETENLWDKRPEIRLELSMRQERQMARDKELAAFLQQRSDEEPSPVVLDDKEIDELRALGYVD